MPRGLSYAPLLVLVGVVCYLISQPASVYDSIDFRLYHDPHLRFFFDHLWRGDIPWWNPHIGLGRPFISDIQNACFYPPIYLFLAGVEIGMPVFLLLHFWFVGQGMRRLAELLGATTGWAWLGALGFILSGAILVRLFEGQILIVAGISYLPWLVAEVFRLGDSWDMVRVRNLAVLLAMQFLTGHPQVFWISCVGLAVLVLAWRACEGEVGRGIRIGWSVAQLATGGVFALALSCVAWGPFLDLLTEGNRATPSLASAGYGALEPVHLFGIATFPPFDFNLYFESNYFVGFMWLIPALIGAPLAKDSRLRALLYLSCFALAFSFGKDSPLFRLCYHVLPGTDGFRIPARFSIWICFCLPLIGSVALSRCAELKWFGRGSFALAGVLVIGLAFCFPYELPEGGRLSFWRPALSCLLAGVVPWLLGGGLGRRFGSRLAMGTAVIVVTMEAVPQAMRYKAASSIEARLGVDPAYPAQALITEVLEKARASQPFLVLPRLVFPPSVVPRNFAMTLGYSQLDATTSLFLRRPWMFLHAMMGIEPSELNNSSLDPAIYHRPFEIKYVTQEVGLDAGSGAMVFNAHPFPRVFFAGELRTVANVEEALRAIEAGHPIERVLLLEAGDGPQALTNARAVGQARITSFESSAMVVEVEASAAGFAVLNEAWYPGWHARVNGQAAEVLPANVWMRAVPVPAGRSKIELTFRPRYQVISAVMSLAAMALLGYYAVRRRKDEAVPAPPTESGN